MNQFDSLFSSPLLSEWFINLFLRSGLILLIGWGVLQIRRSLKAPLVGKITVVIMVILLLVPMIPFLSNLLSTQGIPELKNEIVINYDYIVVTADPETQSTDKGIFPFNLFFWINLAGGIWFSIFFVKLIRIINRLFYLNRFKRNLIELKDDPSILAIFKSFNVRRGKIPRVYLSAVCHSPVAFGIIKPIIVIPEALYKRMSKSEFEAVICHEMSHIIRKDHLWGLIQQLLLAFYWWNPLIYPVSRAFSIASEDICDTHAIRAAGQKAYAKTLISLVEHTGILNRIPGLAGISSPHIDLKERIKKIIQKEREMETKLKGYISIIIMMLSVSAFGLIAGQHFIFTKETNKLTAQKTGKDLISNGTISTEKTVGAISDNIPKKNDPFTDAVGTLNDRTKANKQPSVKSPKITKRKNNIRKKPVPQNPVARKVKYRQPGLSTPTIARQKQEPRLPKKMTTSRTPEAVLPPKVLNKSTHPDKTVAKQESSEKPLLISNRHARRIKYVKPLYPVKAAKLGVGGIVVLEASVGSDGKVRSCRIVRSNKLFSDAAIQAVEQWEYEPYIQDGKAVPFRITVTINFVKQRKNGNKPENFAEKRNRLEFKEVVSKDMPKFKMLERNKTYESDHSPKLIKYVKPNYPEAARLKGIEGTVMVEIKLRKDGTVQKCKATEGPKELRNAAEEAVSQWVYEPRKKQYYSSIRTKVGLFEAVKFDAGDSIAESRKTMPKSNLPMLGNLTDSQTRKKKKSKQASIQLKKIYHVEPVYPKVAAQARIRATVTLKIYVKADGTVENAKVISGHPLLNRSARSAVRKWKFEPIQLPKGEKFAWAIIRVPFNRPR